MASTSGSFNTNSWVNSQDNNTTMYHIFSWTSTRSGYKTTVNYKVTIGGTSTLYVYQSTSLVITANDQTKVNKSTIDSHSSEWRVGDVLIEGSFTVDHSYNDGSASFSVNLSGHIFLYPNYNNPNATGSKTFDITPISIGLPKISSITDNGNNTITVKFYYGENLTGTTSNIYLKVGSDCTTNSYGYTFSHTKEKINGPYEKTISLSSITGASSDSDGLMNISSIITQKNSSVLKTSTVYTGKNIYYYKPPNSVNTPTVTGNKEKNTPTSILTFNWNKPSAGNASSPVKGYRIRIWKNGSTITIPTGSNTTGYYYDRDGASNTSYTIDLSKYSMNVGDSIQIGIYAYTVNGAGSKLWSGGGTNEVFSSAIILVADKNFKAYAKLNGKWHKVVLIHANLNNVFKEVENIHKI